MAAKTWTSGNHGATPSLCARGAERAIDFYKKAFGADELSARVPYQGKVGNANLSIEGARFMLADEFPGHNRSPQTLGGTAVSLYVRVRDVDSLFKRAVKAGAKVLDPLKAESYGRSCKLEDPFGHIWFFNTVARASAPARAVRRAKARPSKPKRAARRKR